MLCQECENPSNENLETWDVPTGWGSYHKKKLCFDCACSVSDYYDDKFEDAKADKDAKVKE